MVLIDLDNFKEVNDLHGHDAGDQLLRACANQILGTTRNHLASGSEPAPNSLASPIVARIGGDEFIIMIQGLVEKDEIQAFLDALRTELAAPAPELPFTLNKSASIGCSRFPQDGQDVEELIKRADIAMYHAKNSGKNRSELYAPEIGARSTAEIRRDVLNAVETDGFFLEYQPKICANRRKVRGVEALVRWNHPEYGRFMPDFWLPAIANSPAISALGEWVLKRAMKDQMALAKAGHDIFMSVNIGPGHFVTPGFVQSVDAIRDELGFDAARLEIEVTEDALFVSEDQAVEAFNSLNKSGYKVSIDDFGKGYSNIARLARLPVDFLKIDRSIIVGAFEDDRIRAILESTFDMARKLDCKTVAEGVETLQHAEFATRLGANCLQGYYFAKSMPLDDLKDWLRNQSCNSLCAYQERLKQAV
ncbi:bifunctional diguanylate cyclase/phosphodiesterase [Roseibium sp.]|uniref:putative bifunctional diguanylate cyclase/phosphodiesterase n=1 Tax=Roseibium sp. TaxID=1936156 RepID=UPI00326472AD